MIVEGNQKQSVKFTNKIKSITPGLILLFVVAYLAKILGGLFPLIGSVVIAILLGVFIRNLINIKIDYAKGVEFTLKKLLKLAIILLGTSLSISEVREIGSDAFVIVVAVVVTGILITVYFGKLLKIDSTLGLLIGVGTSICGATAITASKNVINAKETQTAYAISTIFFFNLLATFLYPWIGQLMDMSQTMFGIWVGTAVHDTSSVVAVGYLYGDVAGETATTVKLIRTLFILPLLLIISLWWSKKQSKSISSDKLTTRMVKVFPWFILGFIGMSLINSTGMIPFELKTSLTSISKYLIIMVMVAVGLQVEPKKLLLLGAKPFATGLFASVIVSIVSLTLIVFLGLN